MRDIKTITHKELAYGKALPYDFDEKDIKLNAPRLFSDKLMLLDIWRLAQYGGIILAISLDTSRDKDIRAFYTDLLTLNLQLINEGADLAAVKGVHIEAPYIPVPEKAEVVQKEAFFTGIIGKRRGLTGLEIKRLFRIG